MRFLCSFAVSSLSMVLGLGVAGCGDDDSSGGEGGGSPGASGVGANGSGAGAEGAGAGPSSSGSGNVGNAFPGEYNCDAPSGTVPPLRLQEVASGLSEPVQLKAAPGDNERLYIVEQDGAIRILKDGAVLETPFLDLGNVTSGSGEQGLLAIAFHPGYAENGRFFVHYSGEDGETTIVEYHRSSNPEVADPNPVGTVFTLEQPFANHNGGSIEFGGDNMLYIFLGDGGDGGDPDNRGQNLDDLLGKVLRIDVSSLPYTIPAGNMPGGKPEIWDMGVRNPWRSTFDVCTGDLYIGDVGQGQIEEVNVEPAGQGNKNYGWRLMEGNNCFNPDSGCEGNTALTRPVSEYPHRGDASIVGGYVYRGHAIPALRGTYFYGDYNMGRIWSFVWSGGQATGQVDLSEDLQSAFAISPSSFGQDNSGEVYVVSHGGQIFLLAPE